MADVDHITRSEFTERFNRMEDHADEGHAEVMAALERLRVNMNGQFAVQGQLLSDHRARIAVLEDRGQQDVIARWGAGFGAFLAALAGYFSLR